MASTRWAMTRRTRRIRDDFVVRMGAAGIGLALFLLAAHNMPGTWFGLLVGFVVGLITGPVYGPFLFGYSRPLALVSRVLHSAPHDRFDSWLLRRGIAIKAIRWAIVIALLCPLYIAFFLWPVFLPCMTVKHGLGFAMVTWPIGMTLAWSLCDFMMAMWQARSEKRQNP